MTIAIGIVGVGKIARDQHMPTVAASRHFHLAGAVSRHARDLDIPVRQGLAALKEAVPELAAIAVCTPPVGRLDLLREAFDLGLHVMLEKPPAATLGEAEQFHDLAVRSGKILLQGWHSRMAAAVEPARAWLATRRIRHVRVDWLEDVRVWHPGQEWIWTPGIGVFDPGINALSILTRLLPSALALREGTLRFPANRNAPIAADLILDAGQAYQVAAAFSFDQRGPQTWSIEVETDDGVLALLDGGRRWTIDGVDRDVADDRPEYARLYDHFADLIERGVQDVDLQPFRLVADAFLVGKRAQVEAFAWT